MRVLLLVLLVSVAGCKKPLGAACTSDSDCESMLLCTAGVCKEYQPKPYPTDPPPAKPTTPAVATPAAAKSEDDYPDAVKVFDAPDLLKVYAANGVRADELWKGKSVRVVGKIDSIDNDILDKPFVMLKSTTALSVQVFPRPTVDNKRLLLKMEPGSTVGFDGVVDGKTMMFVVVKDARINAVWVGDKPYVCSRCESLDK